jgi:hypothetical protein
MSRFVVNLAETPEEKNEAGQEPEAPTILSDHAAGEKKPSKFSGFLKKAGIVLLALLVITGIGSYFYWQSVKKTPSYALAMLVDGARRDDKVQIEQFLDTKAVVENFMPQVTAKAIELYGRNVPPHVIARVEQIAAPAIPVIKQRAEIELPQVIREKTARAEKVPYWMIALFANRAVEISTENNMARVKSIIPDRPLELIMRRDGDRWKVVGIRDEVLARRIAERIGQDLISAAAKGGIKKAAEQFGVKNLEALENMDIFK